MFSRLLPKISASLSNLHLRGSVYFLQGFSHHESFAAVDLLERESPKGKDCAGLLSVLDFWPKAQHQLC